MPEKAKSLVKSAGKKITSAPKTAWDSREIVVTWGNKRISGGYTLLSKAIRSSKAMNKSTSKAILEYVSSTYESAAKPRKRIMSHTAVFVNALLASDFSKSMESWLGHMFNEAVPSLYDKAIDAVYNATHIGGGQLHRLFDESHSLWGMWDKVRDASPDDALLQETVGYAKALGKDFSSSVGIPLFDWSKSPYDFGDAVD